MVNHFARGMLVQSKLIIIFSFTSMGVANWYLGNFGPQKK